MEARSEALVTARQWIFYSHRLVSLAVTSDGVPVLEPKEALAGVALLQKALEVIELAVGTATDGNGLTLGQEDWLAMRVARTSGPTFVDFLEERDRKSGKSPA